jgi:FKBP-type peptidyl-prolyl cis-trans isomerase 2
MPIAGITCFAGERSSEMIAKLPRSAAPAGLEAGVSVQLTNGMTAVVTSVDEESVTIDANHPLAGQSLDFEVTLTKRTPAAQLQTATFGAGCFW